MDKEKLLYEITNIESEIRLWKGKAETDPDPKMASAARMDLRRVQRIYKDLLLDLSDSDCDEIKQLAADKGIVLEFFDDLNCPEEEKKQIKAQRDTEGCSELEEYYRTHPEAERSLREAVEADCRPLFDKLEPKKKKGFFGSFGKE